MDIPVQELHSGDVLLMNRKCWSMKDPLSIGLCLGAKTVSPYDHTGMVYRVDAATASTFPQIEKAIAKGGGPSPSGTYIVEANVGGVTLRSLEARLRRTTSNEIAVRPIVIPPSERPLVEQRMHRMVEESLSYDYKSNLLDFVAMSFKPPDKLDRMQAAARANILRNEIELIRDALDTLQKAKPKPNETSSERQRREINRRVLLRMKEEYVAVRKWLQRTYFAHLPWKPLDSDLDEVDFDHRRLFFVDGENVSGATKGVFCSELVVHLWQRTGIVKRFPPSTSYSPSDFDLWDDEFNFRDERYGMGPHQTLYPAHKAPRTVQRPHVMDGCSEARHQALKGGDELNAFVAERKQVLSNFYREAHLRVAAWMHDSSDLLESQEPLIPTAWMVPSTTNRQLVRDMPERLIGAGLLFSGTGVLFSSLTMYQMEIQLGMAAIRGSPLQLGGMLAMRALGASIVQAISTYYVLQKFSSPDSTVMRVETPPVSSFADERHPYYTTCGALLGCGLIGSIATYPMERRALLFNFGPDRAAAPTLRFLSRGAVSSAVFHSFSYGGGWLIWYECFGPLFFTTETSFFRRRPDCVRGERWAAQQRDAVLGAMAFTVVIDTLLYPLHTWHRRRMLRSFWAPLPPPSSKTSLVRGMGLQALRSSCVSALTGAIVWNTML